MELLSKTESIQLDETIKQNQKNQLWVCKYSIGFSKWKKDLDSRHDELEKNIFGKIFQNKY